MRRILVVLCLVLQSVAAFAQSSGVQPIVETGTVSSTTCPGSGCLEVDVQGEGAGAFQLAGTWTGEIEVLGSTDCTNYDAVPVKLFDLGANSVSSVTANGVWAFSTGGLCKIRVTGQPAWTSGTADVTVRALPITAANGASSGGGGGGSVTQGTTPWVVSAAALPLPSGASTAAKQDTGNASLASIDSKLTSPISVTGAANTTQSYTFVGGPDPTFAVPSGTASLTATWSAYPGAGGFELMLSNDGGVTYSQAFEAPYHFVYADFASPTVYDINRSASGVWSVAGFDHIKLQQLGGIASGIISLQFSPQPAPGRFTSAVVTGSSGSLADVDNTYHALFVNPVGPFAENSSNQLNTISVNTTGARTASNTLNGLDLSATLSLSNGMYSIGMQTDAGTTLDGTLTPEYSIDGGTTWSNAQFYDPTSNVTSSSLFYSNPNPLTVKAIVVPKAGVTHVRVRTSAFTGGNTTPQLTAQIGPNAGPVRIDAGVLDVQGPGGLPVNTIDQNIPNVMSPAGNPTLQLLAVQGNASGVPIPVSASSLPLPTGASTSALQTTGNTSLASIDTKLTSPLTVTGPLTDTQLRATPVPVSASSLPLPTGASTSALQTTGNTSLGSIDTKTPALGQATMANSSPVVISSNQSTLPVSAASLPLPSGAATEATLSTAAGDINGIRSVLENCCDPINVSDTVLNATLVLSGGADGSTPPIKTGAVFNTTQPTVTNGQRVDNQATARGAQIVAPGVEGFTVTQGNAGSNAQAWWTKLGDGSTGPVTVIGSGAQAANTDTGLVVGVKPNSTIQANLTSLNGNSPLSSSGLNTALLAVGGPAVSGGANSGGPLKIGGVFNTTQPTVTNGQVVDAQTTARGAQIIAKGVDGFSIDNTSFTATQATGTNLHAVIDTGSTTAVTQATASNLKAQVQGEAATGATKAGNPVQIGGVFNTTQPTVTNGQAVEAQSTARGAQIVAPGVDGFAVTNTPPANQSVNVAQVAGTNTVTAGVAGLQAVGGNVANGATATSNPVPVGGVFQTSPTTLTNGQTATAQYTAAQNLKTDLATIAGTAPTTSGKVDVKGADGDVFVRQATAANLNATVTQLALTKGTQGSTGVSTQDLKDAGRTAISFYANVFASGATTVEKIITWDQSKGTGAVTAATASYTITNGKTLRITGLQVATRGNATATIQTTTFSLRLNTAGACVVTSTPILFAAQSATPATASAWDRVIIPIPDGYEIAGNGTISICITGNSTFTTNAPTWAVNLIGFEY